MTQKTDTITSYHDIAYEDVEKKLTDEWQSPSTIFKKLMPNAEGTEKRDGIGKVRRQLTSALRYGLVDMEVRKSAEYKYNRFLPHYRRLRE